jgi:hypothetical protein
MSQQMKTQFDILHYLHYVSSIVLLVSTIWTCGDILQYIHSISMLEKYGLVVVFLAVVHGSRHLACMIWSELNGIVKAVRATRWQ